MMSLEARGCRMTRKWSGTAASFLDEPRTDFFSNFFPRAAFSAFRLGDPLLNRGLRLLVQVFKKFDFLLVQLLESNAHRFVRRRVTMSFHLLLEQPLRLRAE